MERERALGQSSFEEIDELRARLAKVEGVVDIALKCDDAEVEEACLPSTGPPAIVLVTLTAMHLSLIFSAAIDFSLIVSKGFE